MRHRAGAVALATLGAVLLVAAALAPFWWAGPIQIAGRVIHNKTVHISMLRATGCNAGDGTCMALDVDLLFRSVGIVGALLACATAWFAIELARRPRQRHRHAERHARLALLGSGFVSVCGVLFLSLLPERFDGIPLGPSALGLFVGAAAVVTASLLTLRGTAVAKPATPEPMDVRELLSTDMLRPANLGPEPKLGRFGAVVDESPSQPAPAAPRFRPLYEVEGFQGLPPRPAAPGFAALPVMAAPDGVVASAVAPAYPGADRAMRPPAAPREPVVAGGARAVAAHGHGAMASLEAANSAMVTERSDALPDDSGQGWQVDAPLAGAAAAPTFEDERGLEQSFDALTAPSQPSLAMLAQRGAGEQADRGDEEVAAVQDSSVFLRAGGRRVPTATTSASMAALAALSKPAVITMTPAVARKLAASGKGGDTMILGAAPPGPVPACPHCEAPMSWAARHLRYFCSSCQVYF
jgi:hypothetical protein